MGSSKRRQTTADVEARYGVPVGGVPPPPAGPRRPLTTADHIFWLLATVFTAGLALPLWIWFAARGHRA